MCITNCKYMLYMYYLQKYFKSVLYCLHLMYLICDIGFILEHELLKIVLQIQAVERVAGIQKCFLLFDMTRIIYTMTAVEKDSHQVL